VVLSVGWSTLKVDKEKSKDASFTQQNGFRPAFLKNVELIRCASTNASCIISINNIIEFIRRKIT